MRFDPESTYEHRDENEHDDDDDEWKKWHMDDPEPDSYDERDDSEQAFQLLRF